jgi:hypothetical protein
VVAISMNEEERYLFAPPLLLLDERFALSRSIHNPPVRPRAQERLSGHRPARRAARTADPLPRQPDRHHLERGIAITANDCRETNIRPE